jgi:acyl-CoA thioesterase I
MKLRLVPWAIAAAVAFVPITPKAQELAVAAVPAFVLPSIPPSLSAECRSKRTVGERFRSPLRSMRRAMSKTRQVRVLAVGSSSTVGIGASSASATYVARLEPTLEGALKGLDFQIIGRGVSGEVAQGAADRMKREVEEAKPDLVVWQVGTNDAIRRVGIDSFKTCLKNTLSWLAERKIDVVLIDPQYGDVLTKDAHYEQVVGAVAEVAREARVLLVDRFEAMRELQRERGDKFYLTSDNLHMNDTGHRCMAEQLSRAIISGLLHTDADQERPLFVP